MALMSRLKWLVGEEDGCCLSAVLVQPIMAEGSVLSRAGGFF